MSTCIDCGCELARGETSPCLSCSIESNQKREAAGCGELICRDCDHTWSAIDSAECPNCDSDAVEPLSVAQARAELEMDGGL